MVDPTDVQRLAKQLVGDASPEDRKALVEALLSGQAFGFGLVDRLPAAPAPSVGPAPAVVRGFRVRLDLLDTKPPVWRRLELPGNVTLPQLHEVVQAAMGWLGGHLHRFRTGKDHRSPHFVTQFDLEEGEDGVPEDGVRLDQLVASVGDVLGYEYDFGDGWDHLLKVEAVLDEAPASVRCLGGRMACPPEDCGGPYGYAALAAWVRSGYDDELVPEVFGSAADARDWLPLDWHPDHFDVEEANTALASVSTEPLLVNSELVALSEQLRSRGDRSLQEVLLRGQAAGPAEVTDEEASRLTETYRIFLELLGDGVTLTTAGYLPPALVEQLAESTGITSWWIGKANREDLTAPVAVIREMARALGLVSVRKGRLSPTAAGKRCRTDPRALWRHIVGRLPVGTPRIEQEAGWLALAVAGSGAPAHEWRHEISDLLYALGWRSGDHHSAPLASSQTLDVLHQLAGAAREGWGMTGVHPAVAASARAAVRRGVA